MKIVANDIKTLANETKIYVEKHYSLPGSLTINKVKYTYPQIGYILAKAVNNPGKDITYINLKKAPNKNGEKVNFTISKNDYKKLAKDLVNFIDAKHDGVHRLPNFLTYNKKKIKQRVFIYSFAKIIVWYYKNKELPNTCRFKTSETVKPSATKKTTTTKKSKYGHAIRQGCNNMGQNTSFYCACHSFQEIVRNLYNIIIPQKKLASIMGTTTSGTGHDGIRTATVWFNKKYDKNLKMEEKYFSDVGASGVKRILESKDQDCFIHLAYQGKYGHYEVPNKVSGDTWNIQNSLGSKCSNGCYCGYKQNRPFATEKAWINAKSGVKSVLIFTRG